MSTFNNLDSKSGPATEYQSQSWQCSVYKVIEFQISNSMFNSKANSNSNGEASVGRVQCQSGRQGLVTLLYCSFGI